MNPTTLLKKFSHLILTSAISFAVSGNALATHVNGTIKISNQTQCNIDLDQSTESSKGVIELENQTIKPKKTSSKITFQLDTGIYGSADVFANAHCEAQGSGSAKYWTLLLAGRASGSFNTKADCNAAISGTVEGGQGILPGAFVNLDAHGVDKKGNRTGELNIFVSRKSASGIVISSSLSTPQFCGPGNGFYRVKAPDVKPMAIKGFGEEITKGYFDEHTITIEDISKNTKLLVEMAKQAVSYIPTPPNMSEVGAHAMNIDKNGIFSFRVRASYQQSGTTWTIPHTADVTVKNFEDLSSLNLCAGAGADLVVYPTLEFPNSKSCR